MPKVVNFKKPPQGEHNLYSFSNGSLGLRAPQVSFSNGMAWTSDNRTMFHNQSIPGTTYVYDFDQNTGDLTKILTRVQLPTKYPQSCCFGGKNYDVLYVTSVSHFSKTPVPADGLLYQLTELGAKGKETFEFAG
ncbi:unnamed protein product [Ixodes persulcatus]